MKTLEEVKRLVGRLPVGELPLALLPVQIQTRFVTRDGRTQLLVRVYPDEMHLDGHEPALTTGEAEWGRAYWRLIWPAARNQATLTRAWEQLAERFGARRAAWIARRLTPTNPTDRPAANRPGRPPVFPALGTARNPEKESPVRARLLPDRWVVIGYRGGERVLLEAGAPIPATLPVSPAPDAPGPPQTNPELLPIDPGMRWMVDFAEAERVGMGIRIDLPAAGAAPPRFDALVVFGVRAALTAEAGATQLEAQLDAHHFTRGLAFVGPGTPTNNTADASSGFTRRDPSAAASFQVEVRAPQPAAGSDGGVAARLLGIRRAVFAGVDGAGGTEDVDARRLQTALWPVTGGYYLEQIVATVGGQQALTRAEVDAARRHFVDFVRHLGPLPALRVGRQPYGLLPVMSLDLLAASPAGGDRFVQTLTALRASWRSALGRAPRLRPGPEGADPLVEILRMQPSSTGYRARLAFPREFFSPAGVLDGDLEPDLREHSVLLRNRFRQLAVERLLLDPRVLDLIPAQASALLDAPLVQSGELPGVELVPDYLAYIRAASFDDLLAERLPDGFPPAAELRALLYLLLRHSVLLAYGTTAHRILVRRGTLPNAPYREPALVDIVGGARPGRTATLPRTLEADPTLRAGIHTLGAAQEPEAAELDELRASLDHLRTRPVDVLTRHTAGCLDLFSYRLDAWITSLATRRLSAQRRQIGIGIGIGGFGWVVDLAPEPRPPVDTPPAGEGGGVPLHAARERGGAIHAPSMAQASAAAVLRSGYLTQPGESDARPFAIDLTSERVRLAQWLLDGIREGQPLGALLGYRFERSLHDRGLDRFIAGFRRVSWLAQVYGARELVREAELIEEPRLRIRALQIARRALEQALSAVRSRRELPRTADIEAIEELAAAEVVDGLALARLHEAGGPSLEFVHPDAPAARGQLVIELAALHGAVDALSDALTAEGVYQIVRGNPSRAAASVDAVAHGEIQPPDLTFAETPRGGIPFTHRLVVLLPAAAAAAPTDVRLARKSAEPALDAWLRQMLGDLAGARCRGELLDGEGAVLHGRDLALAALGISHLDALYLSAAASPGRPSDLERLVEHHVRRLAPGTVPADARFRLIYERTPSVGSTQLGLGEFLEVLGAFRDTILGARALDGRDLAPAEAQQAPGVDANQLRTRADRAVAALRRARDGLAQQRALVAATTDPARQVVALLDVLRERLLDHVFFGQSEALPLSPHGGDEQARAVLLHQAGVAEQEAARRLDRLAELDGGFDRAAAPPEERVRHDLERLRVVFGPQFRALPLVRPANAAQLNAAVAASTAVQGGDPLQALSWLQGVARVRPAASRVLAAMSYAAALLRPSALQLRVAQLPPKAGERWVALPTPAGTAFPRGRLSLVAHVPQTFSAAQPFAGLLIDDWVETVPDAELTTGIGFNYDGPGARPPQTILLASAPPGAARWEVETLEQTLLETLELAQLRALDPQALGDDVLLQRALPALYVSLNLAGTTISTDFSRAQ